MTTESFERLAERAEQAVLGAVLLRPDVFQDITYLDPAQFADPARAALFGAIRTELSRDPDQSGSTLSANLDNVYAATGATPDYEALANACPHPESVATYARMLVEADLHRTMQHHAERLHETSEPNTQLHAEADVLAPANFTLSRDAEDAPIPGSWRGSRPNREERFLADLIQRPSEFDQLPVGLGPDKFSADSRSSVFEALRDVHRRSEPVDRLTIAWELDRLQRTSIIAQPGVDALAYVDRLADTPVEPGTAAELAPTLASSAPRSSEPLSPARARHVGYNPRAQEHAIDRHIDRHREPEYGPPSIDPPSPGHEPGHGPRMGF